MPFQSRIFRLSGDSRRRRWTRGRAIEGSPAGVNYIGPTMSMVQMIGVERRVKNYEQRRARIPGPSINRS